MHKQIVSSCVDFLSLFGYKILAILPVGALAFANVYAMQLKFIKTYLAVVLNKYGKKCFLLIFKHKNYKHLRMVDITDSSAFWIQNDIKLMTEVYCNSFLKNTSKQSCVLVLPELFSHYKLINKEPEDINIPQQLTIFRSAK